MADDLKQLYQTKFYRAWYNMKTRCSNKNYSDFDRYGARGITFCNEWEDFKGFYKDMYKSFSEHVKKYGENDTSLDRINNNGNYNKENCRWATCREQAINRHTTRLIEFNGLKMTIPDWARHLGVKRSTISQRYHVYKWELSKCFNK